MVGKVLLEGAEAHGIGIGGGGSGAPMTGGSDKELGGKVGIVGVFVCMVVESDVVGIERKAFEEDIDPTGTMEIVIFDEVEDGVGREGEVGHVIEETEKRAGFGSFMDEDGTVLEEVGTGSGNVEKVGEANARVAGGEEIAITGFLGEGEGTLFVGAGRGVDAVADKDFDHGIKEGEAFFRLGSGALFLLGA